MAAISNSIIFTKHISLFVTHKTKGIILKSIKYGETSIIVTVFTELFGMQVYMVKGVRQQSKKGASAFSSFQPAAILQMEVYHNELKKLQFIKEYQWAILYENIFFDVIKNAVAMFIIEITQHSIKQPEPNQELFSFMADTLQKIDKSTEATVANVPLWYSLKLAAVLGLGIQGIYSTHTPLLDLQEGFFTNQLPSHLHYVTGEEAQITAQLNNSRSYEQLANIQFSRKIRRTLFEIYQQYFLLHIEGFTELKSIKVLQEVFD